MRYFLWLMSGKTLQMETRRLELILNFPNVLHPSFFLELSSLCNPNTLLLRDGSQSFASTSTLWNCQEIQSISCLVVFRKIVKTVVFRKRKVHCTWEWDVWASATSTLLVLILFILFIFVCIKCFIFVVCGSLFYKLILLAAQPLGIVSIKGEKNHCGEQQSMGKFGGRMFHSRTNNLSSLNYELPFPLYL